MTKTHYTYRLIALNPIDARTQYIGVRSCIGAPESDAAYLGSSSRLRTAERAGVQFRKEIIAEWPSRADAAAHEIALHDLHDVARNPAFFNVAKATSTAFDVTGTRMTPEQRAKISAAHRATSGGMNKLSAEQLAAKTAKQRESMRAMLARRLAKTGSMGNKEWTGEELAEHSRKVSAALASRGVEKEAVRREKQRASVLATWARKREAGVAPTDEQREARLVKFRETWARKRAAANDRNVGQSLAA